MKIHVKENQVEEIEGMSAEYPYTYHESNLFETKVPWHWHEEFEICYVRKGGVKVLTPNCGRDFIQGEAFFINTNVLCTMEVDTEYGDSLLESHLFHSVFLGGHFKSVFYTKYLEPLMQNKDVEVIKIKGENQRQKAVTAKLRRLSALQKHPDAEFQTRNILSEIWLLLLAELQSIETARTPGRQVNQERVQTMMSFMKQKYMNKISLDEIAQVVSVSKRECLRCFQKCLGKTPYEYLMDVRMNMAQKLLKDGDSPVLEVALQTGFSNGAYFGKQFKKVYGMTPGEYRQKYSSHHDSGPKERRV